MKKRVIAVLLSLTVFLSSLSLCKRAYADPATLGVITAIGVLAFEIIGVMNGNYDNAANAIGSILTGVVEGAKLVFYGDDVINPFTGEVVYHEPGLLESGVSQIATTVQGWFDSGKVKIEDGRIKLTYEQYKDLYSMMWNFAQKPEVDFKSEYDCLFFKLDTEMGSYFPVSALPRYSPYLNSASGESYTSVYYSSEKMVFPAYYLFCHNYSGSKVCFNQVFPGFSLLPSDNATSTSDIDTLLSVVSYEFYFPSLSSATIRVNSHDDVINFTDCYVYSNGILERKPISEVDLSDCKHGMITTTGDYPAFLQSLTGFTTGSTVGDLDDLSGTIPTEYNPTISFPINPDLTRPLPDQIMIEDVPGAADLPLSDYEANVKTDIDVPSIITSKFPFCIPYDFVRFLGLLCSDPVAPVFRIPISTNPGNLGAWSGNQTVGKYLNPSEPMFEIDEEIVIDLSVIPLVQPICHTCFIVGFIFLLIHITPKMIQH